MGTSPNQAPAKAVVQVTITDESATLDAITLTRAVTPIGRDPSSVLVLRNKFISTAHAEIVQQAGRVSLRDLRSTNGSRVLRAGKVIPVDHLCDHEMILEDGDRLLLGEETQPVEIVVGITAPVRLNADGSVRILESLSVSDAEAVPRRMERGSLLVLHELSALLRPRRSSEELSHALASWLLMHVEKAGHVLVSLRDPATDAWRTLADQGCEGPAMTPAVARGLQAEALRSGETLLFAPQGPVGGAEEATLVGACAPFVVEGEVIGLVRVDGRPAAPAERMGRHELELIAVAAGQAAPVLELSRVQASCRATVDQAVRGLAAVIETRDAYLAGHTAAVAQLSKKVATRLHLPAEEVARIERAGALHDIGRFGVPTDILNAPGKLSEEQFERIQAVPMIGAAVLERFGFFADLVPVIRHLHERWDGRGYPDGLAGDAIPLAARIVAVADAFHTLVSHRSHQEALDQPQALAKMAEAAGTRFDPRVVGALELTVLSSDEIWEFDAATSIGSGISHLLAASSRK